MKKILTFLTILSTIVAIASSIWGQIQAHDAKRYKGALYEKKVEYEDELGRKVTEITQLEVTNRELKQVGKKDSILLSDYERKIRKLYDELEANGRKLRHTESALLFSEQTRDSFRIKLEEVKDTLTDKLDLLPIKTGYYSTDWTKQKFTYNPNTDSLSVVQVHENEFFVDLFKKRKPNSKGKQVCWLFRWVRPWEYKASIKSLRDSTIIKDAVMINLNR